jgi:hypothetical protein
MGHTVDLIFTDQRKTMQTVKAIMLKEEMERKKAAKLSMTRQEKVDYVNNWKKENDTFLCEAFGLEDGPQFQFLTGIFISPSTSKKQVPFLQEVLQADAAYMSFGKYTLYSVYGTNANGFMSALGFALCLAMRTSKVGCNFGTSLRKHTQLLTSPIIQSSPTRTRVLFLAMEDTVPLAGRFLCSFHRQQHIIKKCGGGKVQKALSALWVYNLLIGCKSVASLSATRKSMRIRCSPQTASTSSTSLKKCNTQPQGVLRVILFACMEKLHLLV